VSKVDDLLAAGRGELGKPYVYGTEGPSTFDCSGLMQWLFAHVGISLPRTSQEQQAAATPVKVPLPGDLVFYGRPAHHVGLYIGAGKMINAPDVNQRVRIDSVGTPTSYGRVAGLGTMAAVPVAVLTSAAIGAGDLLGGVKVIVLEGLFVLLGLAVVGAGAWQITKGRRGATRAEGATP
jgi:hypothetical protein